MPFVFLGLGIFLLIVALRGQASNMASLLKSEFTGSNGFIPWALALIILGMLGYIKQIKPITQAFMGLVLLVMLISNKGFFAQFNAAIKAPAPVNTNTSSTTSAPSPSGWAFPTVQTPTSNNASSPETYDYVVPAL